ncbi:MAG TPA: hypothetical protein VF266_12965 [Thermoanaerobaculia bacterium]
MPDLGVLDTVISVVIVILLLSMVVQSIQTFIKKLLKFKSRQIHQSIEKLLEHVDATAPVEGENKATAEKVMTQFEKLGRTTAFGAHAIESISKVDLAKVVTTIEGTAFLPQPTRDAIAAFFASVRDAQAAVNALSQLTLPPASVQKLNAVRAQVESFVAHSAALFDGEHVNAQLLVKDVMSLSTLDVTGTLAAVASLQTEVEQAAAADPSNAALRDATAAVRSLTTALGAANARMTRLIGRLRERVEAIDQWYDAVMLGFEERYTRHMRTWAFLISIVLVVVMNADVFQVYRRLATSELSQQRVLAQYDVIKKQYENAGASTGNLKTDLDRAFNEAAESYPAMGMQPLDFSDFNGWTPFGWLVMAALLSLGAPFWHDTLESLFGLKNFLRDRTDTKKVEQKSGAGATQS